MALPNKHLKPLCVGCVKRRACKATNIGPVCRTCRPMLAEVVRWSHEAHYKLKPSQQQPHAVQRMLPDFK